MHTTRTFDKICAALGSSPRFIDNRGGARSGKTIAEMQVAAILALKDKRPTVTTVGSDTLPHLKLGAIRDFKFALEDMGWWDEARWSKSANSYTFHTGSVIEFFGINDAPGKALGPARDRLILNEANLLQWDIVRQMLARTSGLVMYDYNPAAPFWGTELIPLRDRYQLVHSTYEDNQYIPAEVRREIEANKDTGNWWRVYGLGLIGQVEGQVFDFKVVDKMPDPDGFKETWGMDFGFSHDPTTLVRCLVHTGRREIYADELLWQTGMTNPEIAAALKGFGLRRSGGPTVWADSAEPKSIAEVAGFGLNVKGCDKRVRVAEQLQAMRGWTIHVTKRSVHLLDEGRKYLYKQRPDGSWTNEPIDFFNHLIDALRYACGPYVMQSKAGVHKFGFK
ncbi:MAG: terminase large subunit [Clostridia bacterium]|nr:terminase large subunit [Clostridia bacterium]